ncbi:molybdenum cofactor guanylyltransferase [Pseudofulvimonas gallinarii]|uniref:Molybdenum cofactor guanylyltransferase n=1 Tax=Pseudofulvimonas gallinarii TaxID=634155 RepID=A0A4R3LLQ0_9GAMM|nr:molybdenum cofactor guanylyltransferase [Pseudofulvimonas gallinarii]TCT01222.1 molybdenum cofactor guanylyltransferase [Pseudofulvimonas gallinarii]THD14987.1 hypothetical protein B1808_00860 [Pseudofulvimonas gallinarii]
MAGSAEPLIGLILAGGKGSRCAGRDKAWLRLDGRPLVCHARERLQPQVGCLVISANRHRWAYARLGLQSIADEPGWLHCGPLAALASAWRRFPGAVLAIVPIDCPLAPRDQVQPLHERVKTDARAAALRCEGRQQPLFAVLHGSLAGAAEDALRAPRPPAMRVWLEAMGVHWLDWPDIRADEFSNINRLEDLRGLEGKCGPD